MAPPADLAFFFFQAEDGIRDVAVTGVQTCALPISLILNRLQRQSDALAGARRRRSLRLAQTFSRSAPPTLGAWPCVFIAPSSCCAFASFVAFRNPRQRGESLEHCSCRAGKRGVSEDRKS